MQILADENIPFGMVAALREAGHDVVSVGEAEPAATDARVLESAIGDSRVLLTLDADFGRMIFAQGFAAPPGVIYLRSPPPSPAVAIERVLRVVRADAPAIDGHFVAIDRKARYHPLPEGKKNA